MELEEVAIGLHKL